MEIIDCPYNNLAWRTGASVDAYGDLTENARFDRWLLIYIFSASLASYFGKVAVRVNLQTFGFSLPSVLSPVLAFLFTMMMDIFANNEQSNTDADNDFADPSNSFDLWGYNDFNFFGKITDPGQLIVECLVRDFIYI